MEVNLPNEGMPKMPSFKYAAWVLPALIILMAFTAVGSMFYQVGPDEVGVVQRFGKYVRTTTPGLRVKLPFGVETVKKVRITHVFKEEFGFRTVVSGGGRSIFDTRQGQSVQTRRVASSNFRNASGGSPFLEESLMLTGDLNVAVVEWIVQYQIKDAVQYSFRIRDQRETLRNMSEAVMRLVVGDHLINEVLTAGRETVQLEVETKLQEVLDSYGAGIEIRNVILQDVNPPDEVKPSFNEVNEARQEREKLINQAYKEYNRVIPRAKGEAEQQIRKAEGYAVDRTNRAKGDAERFTLAWEAYKMSPKVTRKRLYLEMIEKVLPLMEQKIILDHSLKGVLPLLNLTQEKGGQQS